MSAVGDSKARAEAPVQNISLDQADASQNVAAVTQRKIIRNAALSIEIDAPTDGQRRIASIAEARGGFVVTSESRQQGGASSESKPYEVVTIEVRVPAAEFDAVVSEIRAVGGRVKEEKITGQDVTEEYIDLEARLRTKKALEAQFIEIMKSARKVSDALEVQSEMAEVRTEIERLEGRRRFLENQSSLSTIKITLQPPAPLISANTSGFFHSLRQAFGEGLDVAAAITLGLIRVAIALIPVLLLILLPIALAVRLLRRRSRRWPFTEKAAPLE
ncbi:MAG: DUF4349 domain-containing protein [Pyrinomonadaceae bacterium]